MFTYTYTIIINGFCKQGNLDKAEELLMKMEEKDCLPNSCTYNVFVQGLLTTKETSRSIKYLTIMRDKGFSVDATTSEMIVNYLSSTGEDNGFREFLFPKR